MKFYDCETAPNPRRVRIFMAEKGIEIETIQVDLRNGEQLGEDFKKINPDCVVPVLELDSGERLTEVLAICDYLRSTAPRASFVRYHARRTFAGTNVARQSRAARIGLCRRCVSEYRQGLQGSRGNRPCRLRADTGASRARTSASRAVLRQTRRTSRQQQVRCRGALLDRGHYSDDVGGFWVLG